jgi:MYXO-CTERM domain-containing protein
MAIGGMLKRLGFPIALLAASACTVINAGDADALLVFEFIQQGSDVGLNISGSLSGLPSGTSGISTLGTLVGAGLGLVSTGDFFSNEFTVSGPIDFGTGGSTAFPFSYTGDNVVLLGVAGKLRLPNTYVPGNAISGSGLFSGQTLAGLNLSATSGLLGTWTVGSDSIEVRVGTAPPPSSVPGPLPLLGAAAAFAHSRRLRARVRAGSASQS